MQLEKPDNTVNSEKQFWLVGQWKDDRRFEIQGLSASKDGAMRMCRNDKYFITPLTLEEELPDETTELIEDVNIFYPLNQ